MSIRSGQDSQQRQAAAKGTILPTSNQYELTAQEAVNVIKSINAYSDHNYYENNKLRNGLINDPDRAREVVTLMRARDEEPNMNNLSMNNGRVGAGTARSAAENSVASDMANIADYQEQIAEIEAKKKLSALDKNYVRTYKKYISSYENELEKAKSARDRIKAPVDKHSIAEKTISDARAVKSALNDLGIKTTGQLGTIVGMMNRRSTRNSLPIFRVGDVFITTEGKRISKAEADSIMESAIASGMSVSVADATTYKK
jgi:hypothetical protein